MTTARDTFNRQVITYRKSIAAHKFLVPTETLVADIPQSIRMTLTHGSKEGTDQATLMLPPSECAYYRAKGRHLYLAYQVKATGQTGEVCYGCGQERQKEESNDD